jgi:hypothetical protein
MDCQADALAWQHPGSSFPPSHFSPRARVFTQYRPFGYFALWSLSFGIRECEVFFGEETRQRGIINASTGSRTEGLKSCLEFPIQASRDLQEENTNRAQDGSHNALLCRSDGNSSSNGLSRGST